MCCRGHRLQTPCCLYCVCATRPPIASLPGRAESGSLELPPGSSSLQLALSSARRRQGTRRMLLDLLHATNTAAAQRSQELEAALSTAGSVDRQALYRQELLKTSIVPQATIGAPGVGGAGAGADAARGRHHQAAGERGLLKGAASTAAATEVALPCLPACFPPLPAQQARPRSP